MFERLDRLPQDPILGLMALFRADADPRKVDLGVGVYRDDRGETPMLDAVKRAEKAVFEKETTKSYVAPVGNAAFNAAMEKLVFGDAHPVLASEAHAHRAGARRLRRAAAGRGAHPSRLSRRGGARELAHVGESCAADRRLGPQARALSLFRRRDGRCGLRAPCSAALDKLPERAVVLLHASCHNPTRRGPERGAVARARARAQAPQAPAVPRHGLSGAGHAASRRTPLPSGCSPRSCPRRWWPCPAPRISASIASASARCT